MTTHMRMRYTWSMRKMATLLFMMSATVAISSHAEPIHMNAQLVGLSSISLGNGQSSTLTGLWIKSPSSSPLKKTTVLALHDCAGLYQPGTYNVMRRYVSMAAFLVQADYNVLFPDSLTPRKTKSLCQGDLTQQENNSIDLRYEVQAALRWLLAQPEVDPTRIVLMGWSHGATALMAAINLNYPDVAGRKIQPRAAVAFAPSCRSFVQNTPPLYKPTAPLLMLVGENDGVTPPQPCQALTQQLKASSVPVITRIYSQAGHDFDVLDSPKQTGKNSTNGNRDIRLKSRNEAYLDVRGFLKQVLQ